MRDTKPQNDPTLTKTNRVSASRTLDTRTKLRWYQFSLRTLLIVVTLFAVACSWFAVKMGQAKRQKDIVATIRNAGGTVGYDFQYDESGESTLAFAPAIPAWLLDLLGLDFFSSSVSVRFDGDLPEGRLDCLRSLPQIRYLEVGETIEVSNEDLGNVEGLTQLRTLSLGDGKLTDEGLEHLKGLQQLQFAHLTNTRITGSGLRHLAGLEKLESLEMNDAAVAGPAFAYLREAPRLAQLSLRSAKIDGAGWKSLGNLAQIGGLDLAGSNIGDANLCDIRKLRNLVYLGLSDTSVSDEGMAHVAEMHELKVLNLKGSKVTDAGLKQLAALRRLEQLSVSRTDITAQGLDELQKALPSLFNIW
jgi:hypothetical protein